VLGKSVGKDALSEKMTYPQLLGMEEARRLAEDAANKARQTLELFGERAHILRNLVLYILHRNH